MGLGPRYEWNLSEAIIDGKVVCDQDPNDGRPIAYLDRGGYVYCEVHGLSLKRSGRPGIRKLRPAEIKKVASGATIKY